MQRRVFVTAAVYSLIARAQENPPGILGRWYTVERSQGGIGAMMEFLTDGTVEYSPGAIVECKYTFDARKLTLKFVDPEKGPRPDAVLTVPSVSLDKMTTQAASSKPPAPAEEEWTRVGNPEDRGRLLLGNWKAVRDMGGRKVTNNWRFRADGSAVFTVPFLRRIGEYQLTKDVIRVNVDGAISVEGPISWESDILVLPGKRSPTKLRRL